MWTSGAWPRPRCRESDRLPAAATAAQADRRRVASVGRRAARGAARTGSAETSLTGAGRRAAGPSAGDAVADPRGTALELAGNESLRAAARAAPSRPLIRRRARARRRRGAAQRGGSADSGSARMPDWNVLGRAARSVCSIGGDGAARPASGATRSPRALAGVELGRPHRTAAAVARRARPAGCPSACAASRRGSRSCAAPLPDRPRRAPLIARISPLAPAVGAASQWTSSSRRRARACDLVPEKSVDVEQRGPRLAAGRASRTRRSISAVARRAPPCALRRRRASAPPVRSPARASRHAALSRVARPPRPRRRWSRDRGEVAAVGQAEAQAVEPSNSLVGRAPRRRATRRRRARIRAARRSAGNSTRPASRAPKCRARSSRSAASRAPTGSRARLSASCSGNAADSSNSARSTGPQARATFPQAQQRIVARARASCRYRLTGSTEARLARLGAPRSRAPSPRSRA